MSDQSNSAEWLAGRIEGSRARDLHASIAGLIESGELAPGARLPTIRSLALSLDTKVATVTEAWVSLRRAGLLHTRRRGGTFVSAGGDQSIVPPGASRENAGFAGWSNVDMIHGLPDLSVVVDTAPFFAASIDPGRLSDWSRVIEPELHASLGDVWAFGTRNFAVLPTGQSALRAVLRQVVHSPDQPVAVEVPGLFRTLRVVKSATERVIEVLRDQQGPTLESVSAALALGARVFVCQPGPGVPLNRPITDGRRADLARLFATYRDGVTVIEEDACAGLHSTGSLGEHLPDSTVRIAQYWRSFGADITATIVGGAEGIIEPIAADQRRRDTDRVSALVQGVLAGLLNDAQARSSGLRAGQLYAQRHRDLADALGDYGVIVDSDPGIFAWIPVADEGQAVSDLAAIGIRVIAGSEAFAHGGQHPGYLRLAVTRLPRAQARIKELAVAISRVAVGSALVDVE